MTVRGHIHNGDIVLDEDVSLPEGASVTVHILPNGEEIHPEIRKMYGILPANIDIEDVRWQHVRQKYLQ